MKESSEEGSFLCSAQTPKIDEHLIDGPRTAPVVSTGGILLGWGGALDLARAGDVAGLRIDHRFRITPATSRVLHIAWQRA